MGFNSGFKGLKYILLEEPQFLLMRTVPLQTLSKLYLTQRKGLCRSSFQSSSAAKSKLQSSFYRGPGYDIFIVLIASSSGAYGNNCYFHKHPLFHK